jgi:hypothetical protein
MLKIIGGVGIVVVLFIVYPYFSQYASAYFDLNTSIFSNFGETMSTLDILFFNALPLIGLALIFWIGYKVITGTWRR